MIEKPITRPGEYESIGDWMRAWFQLWRLCDQSQGIAFVVRPGSAAELLG